MYKYERYGRCEGMGRGDVEVVRIIGMGGVEGVRVRIWKAVRVCVCKAWKVCGYGYGRYVRCEDSGLTKKTH